MKEESVSKSVTKKPPAKKESARITQTPATDPVPPPSARISGPIGIITHYYSHLSVAVVQLVEDALRIGDIIQIKGHTTDLIQTIESMELDHQHVDCAVMGQLFGIKVRDHVREHDQVFKIPKQ
jgi:putative protease